jgi:membrane-bound serine protease (ClpP class)
MLLFMASMKGYAADKQSDTSSGVVYYVPQFSDFQEISVHEMLFLKKVLKDAEKNNVKAVIFEIDTPGGRVDVALKYVSILAKAHVRTVAFVNAQAISAGMILALAADEIAINPGGTIGDAMPLQYSAKGIRPIVKKPKSESKKVSEEKSGKQSEKIAEEKNTEEKDSEEKGSEEKQSVDKNNENLSHQLKDLIKDFNEFKKQNKSKNEKLSGEEKELVDQKFLTVFYKILQVLAEKHDRPVKVIRAMADPYQKLTLKKDGIEHKETSPLTLSASEAKKLKVVDFICKTENDVKNALGLSECRTQVIDKTPAFYFIYFLANPFVSSFLIILGILGLYIEAKTPGFGFPGGLGVICLSLFFVGHAGIGDSTWLPSAIFLAGIALIALEIFVVPGFGVTGISGIIAVIAALLLAFGWDNFELAVNTVGLSIIIVTVAIFILSIYLPKSSMMKRIALQTTHKSTEGFEAHPKPDPNLMGAEGIAHSMLRPAGIAFFNDKRTDVTTEGDFIEKGEHIKVIKVDGMKVVVEKIS